MQVGQTIYGYHTNNNRAYGPDKERHYMDLPPGWEPYIIDGETKQSWLVGNMKIDKKTMHERRKDYTPIRFVKTPEEVEREYFIAHNGLTKEVMYCKDYDKLKRIEAILGEEDQ